MCDTDTARLPAEAYEQELQQMEAALIERWRANTQRASVERTWCANSNRLQCPSPLGALRELQRDCKQKLRLLASFDDYPGREWTVHAMFWTSRVEGEWFQLDERMKAFIEEVKRTGTL